MARKSKKGSSKAKSKKASKPQKKHTSVSNGYFNKIPAIDKKTVKIIPATIEEYCKFKTELSASSVKKEGNSTPHFITSTIAAVPEKDYDSDSDDMDYSRKDRKHFSKLAEACKDIDHSASLNDKLIKILAKNFKFFPGQAKAPKRPSAEDADSATSPATDPLTSYDRHREELKITPPAERISPHPQALVNPPNISASSHALLTPLQHSREDARLLGARTASNPRDISATHNVGPVKKSARRLAVDDIPAANHPITPYSEELASETKGVHEARADGVDSDTEIVFFDGYYYHDEVDPFLTQRSTDKTKTKTINTKRPFIYYELKTTQDSSECCLSVKLKAASDSTYSPGQSQIIKPFVEKIQTQSFIDDKDLDSLAVSITLNRMLSPSSRHNQTLFDEFIAATKFLEESEAASKVKVDAIFWQTAWYSYNAHSELTESEYREVRIYYKKLKKYDKEYNTNLAPLFLRFIKEAVHVPYQLLRDYNKDSPQTLLLTKKLLENSSLIYFASIDADVKDLNYIFSFYREFIVSSLVKPTILSTGYLYPIINDDSYDYSYSLIDKFIRYKTAQFFAGSTYYPEPNFIVKLEDGKDCLEESFTNSEKSPELRLESAALILDILDKRGANISMHFVNGRSIITSLPSRCIKDREIEEESYFCLTKENAKTPKISQNNIATKTWLNNLFINGTLKPEFKTDRRTSKVFDTRSAINKLTLIINKEETPLETLTYLQQYFSHTTIYKLYAAICTRDYIMRNFIGGGEDNIFVKVLRLLDKYDIKHHDFPFIKIKLLVSDKNFEILKKLEGIFVDFTSFLKAPLEEFKLFFDKKILNHIEKFNLKDEDFYNKLYMIYQYYITNVERFDISEIKNLFNLNLINEYSKSNFLEKLINLPYINFKIFFDERISAIAGKYNISLAKIVEFICKNFDQYKLITDAEKFIELLDIFSFASANPEVFQIDGPTIIAEKPIAEAQPPAKAGDKRARSGDTDQVEATKSPRYEGLSQTQASQISPIAGVIQEDTISAAAPGPIISATAGNTHEIPGSSLTQSGNKRGRSDGSDKAGIKHGRYDDSDQAEATKISRTGEAPQIEASQTAPTTVDTPVTAIQAATESSASISLDILNNITHQDEILEYLKTIKFSDEISKFKNVDGFNDKVFLNNAKLIFILSYQANLRANITYFKDKHVMEAVIKLNDDLELIFSINYESPTAGSKEDGFWWSSYYTKSNKDPYHLQESSPALALQTSITNPQPTEEIISDYNFINPTSNDILIQNHRFMSSQATTTSDKKLPKEATEIDNSLIYSLVVFHEILQGLKHTNLVKGDIHITEQNLERIFNKDKHLLFNFNNKFYCEMMQQHFTKLACSPADITDFREFCESDAYLEVAGLAL